MKFWLVVFLIVIVALLFKSYMFRGVRQALTSPIWAIVYATISIGSMLVGVITTIFAFSDGMIGLTFLENFAIAFMLTILCCEFFLFIFFLFDDAIILGGYFQKKASLKKPQNDSSDKSRRRFVKTLGLGLTALPFSSFLYGITKGKYNFNLVELTLTFKNLPKEFNGFRIAQFSDFHAGSFDSFEKVKEGLALLQKQNADLILFTGDLVNDLEAEVLPYKSILKNLEAPFGKFSVLGNHDYSQDIDLFESKEAAQANFEAIKKHYHDVNFQLLNNDSVKIEKENQHIRLIGVENWGKGFVKEGDIDKAIANCKENEFSILMSHDPTHWEEKVLPHKKHIDITLSGHTHGTQVGIEMLGIKWSPIQYLYKRWAGLYKELGQYLYVNRGFGFIAFAGRVGIPPEITVLTLKSQMV
ncbi:metallophosphoesterase [Flagellimonas sp. S174]|uniref:metallophosphoesterase n=1 Tax=Flagellimonas sp. S174 TaxID=3410790 RepID=UPI003BF61EC2